jgi:hypothetical protein
MNNPIRRHGERYVKKFPVNLGKTVYFKIIRFCSVHGEIDLFHCANFDASHGDCPNPQKGAAAVLVFKKAA